MKAPKNINILMRNSENCGFPLPKSVHTKEHVAATYIREKSKHVHTQNVAGVCCRDNLG